MALRRLGLLPALLAAALLGGCSATGPSPTGINAIGAENEYANVIQQIGGAYVHVTAIMSNPNADPHSFEASPVIAREVADARLVVQNGLGYDGFMNTIEAGTPGSHRLVIDVQRLLGLPNTTPNPHLWYSPGTMPAVARAIARDLAALDPRHAGAFAAAERRFVTSLDPWDRAIAAFRSRYAGVPVATTEPVADDLLQAMGADDLTPWALQADVMNGVDPPPQDIAAQRDLLTGHRVRALVYNQQVTDPLTRSLIGLARASHVPVVGVYETMPVGYDYQSWMLAEVQALRRAVADGTSTERL